MMEGKQPLGATGATCSGAVARRRRINIGEEGGKEDTTGMRATFNFHDWCDARRTRGTVAAQHRGIRQDMKRNKNASHAHKLLTGGAYIAA